MNIFNKYGIKEVADVVFYSITRIGEEEFYTPVLFFDTLKISTIDKSVETVNGKGGKGNGKILSWNFEKDTKIKLEDALFSQMSLDMFMNGRIAAKMSDWTSTIAKLNVANKYGQKNYSTKAYPSPKLTKAEEEIVFRCAQKAGYNPITGVIKTSGLDYYYNLLEEEPDNWATNYNKYYERDWRSYKKVDSFAPFEQNKYYYRTVYNGHEGKYLYDTINKDDFEDSYVAQNRKFLMEHYYKRNQPAERAYDLSEFLDYNSEKYSGVQIMIGRLSAEEELNEAKRFHDLGIGEIFGGWRDLVLTYENKEELGYNLITRESGAKNQINITLDFSIQKTIGGIKGLRAYITAIDPDLAILKDILTGYYKDQGGNPVFYIGDEFFLSHMPYFIFPNYLEDAIGDLCWCDQRDKFYLAMPQQIINEIAEEIDSFSKIGRFENDLYEAQNIDRFEKCLVDKKEGFKIDLNQQLENIKKLYRNDMDNYIVYYDAKTMLPFMLGRTYNEKTYSQKCTRYFRTEDRKADYLNAVKSYFRGQYPDDWVDALTNKDFIINQVAEYDRIPVIYFNLIKQDYFTLKYGTVYYKWSRTIDDNNNESTYIGTDLSIDADTFSGEYMIVGETLIREQKTGKDQRYQFVLNRAAISASTKIQLQAAGGPTTFSVDIDVLQPLIKNKASMELRQYNVEKDEVEGGYKIIPQNKRHSYTSIIQTYEEVIVENNEIY